MLYGQSITYFGDWLVKRGQSAELASLDRGLDPTREDGLTELHSAADGDIRSHVE